MRCQGSRNKVNAVVGQSTAAVSSGRLVRSGAGALLLMCGRPGQDLVCCQGGGSGGPADDALTLTRSSCHACNCAHMPMTLMGVLCCAMACFVVQGRGGSKRAKECARGGGEAYLRPRVAPGFIAASTLGYSLA